MGYVTTMENHHLVSTQKNLQCPKWVQTMGTSTSTGHSCGRLRFVCCFKPLTLECHDGAMSQLAMEVELYSRNSALATVDFETLRL